MATPKKTKKGQYSAIVYVGTRDGKPVYKRITAPTLREFKMQEQLEKHNFEQVRHGRITVDQAIAEYIESRTNVLSPSTIRGYLKIQRNNINLIKNKRTDDLTNKDLQVWVNDLAATHKSKTVQNAIGLVLAALDMNDPNKKYKITRPQKDVPQYNTPDDADVSELLDKADRDMKKAILLSAFGTLRRGEVCGLKYKDILRDMNAVYVHAVRVLDQHNTYVYKEVPKTDSSVRVVILPKEAILALGNGSDDDFIVNLTPSAISNRFRRLTTRCGMSCTFHELRHYAASIMHAIGVPDQYIMERGGWKTDSTLKTIYRNTLKDKKNAFTKMTNEYLTEHFDTTKIQQIS